MRVVGQDKLKIFTAKRTEHVASLQSWLAEAKGANWSCHDDILNEYKGALVSGSDNVTFIIGKGAIRLITRVLYRNGIIRIDEVGKSVKQITDLEKLAGGK